MAPLIRRHVRQGLRQLSPHAPLALLTLAFLLSACGKGGVPGY